MQNAVKQLDKQYSDISEILLLARKNYCNYIIRTDKSYKEG